MNSSQHTARLAGFLYLLMGIIGMLGILYIPSILISPGDAATTASNIQNNETLYRLGIFCQLVCQVVFVFLILELNKLLKPVNERLASQMVMLVTVSVPIAFVILTGQLAVPILLDGPDYLSSFSPGQLQSLTLLCFQIYEQGIILVQVFWGLWLLPFGLLVLKSKFIPRLFGILLVLGGVGYILDSLTHILLPEYTEYITTYVTIPSGISELAILFWLLTKGVRTEKQHLAAETV